MVDEEELEEGEVPSLSKTTKFFTFGSESDKPEEPSKSKKSNKKNKQTFLKKLKNSFGKKKKINEGTNSPGSPHKDRSTSGDFTNQTSERRQSPRKHSSTIASMVPNPAYVPADRNSPKASGDLRQTQSTPNINHARSRNSNPGSGSSPNHSPSGRGRRDGRGRGRGRGGKFFEFKSRGGGRSMTFK